MSFTIDPAGNFLVNGASKGHVFDAVQNDPSLRSDAKAAFDIFWIGQQAQVAAIQAQLDSLGGLPAVQAAQKAKRIADAQAAKAAADAVLIAEGAEAADGTPVKS